MCETHNYCVDRSIIHAAELLSRGLFATFSVQHRLEFLGMNRAPLRSRRSTNPSRTSRARVQLEDQLTEIVGVFHAEMIMRCRSNRQP